ncbi:MAG: hypothetical protein OEM81_12740 [Acidimicrobiia bacterium]|nr:hypothetical protein [Acidimicrobiia bacterium]
MLNAPTISTIRLAWTQPDHLATEDPFPAAQLVDALPVGDLAGTSGEGDEEATVRAGEGDAGHDPKLFGAYDNCRQMAQWGAVPPDMRAGRAEDPQR